MDPVEAASHCAIHAEDTVTFLKNFLVKACGADIFAGTAIGTESFGDPFKQGKVA
jgi:hypothetical protein